MRKSDYLGLIGDLSVEYEYFEAAALRVKAAGARIAQSSSDTLSWYSQAYLIHNLYNSFEAYFLRVSKFFENNLPRDEWHKTLLDRMSVAIEEYRPAVLDAADRSVFHELGAFRHVVRHLYDREIDPKRMETAAESAPAAIKRFPEIHHRFSAALRTTVDLAAE